MFKKIIICYFLLSSISLANEINKESPALRINSQYFEKFETKNIVFNEVYKNFIKNYNEEFKTLEFNIESNGNRQDIPAKHIYLKVDDLLKNFKYLGNKNFVEERNGLIQQSAYDIKRVSKIKLDYQEKEIDTFLNNQVKSYGEKLKSLLNEYDITEEEKVFISARSKNVINILKESIEKNKGSAKSKLAIIEKDLTLYQSIQNQYKKDLDKINRDIDNKIFKDIWTHVRSQSKYPSAEE